MTLSINLLLTNSRLHESSVGVSSTANPKHSGKPSNCLLRHNNIYLNQNAEPLICICA